MRVVRTEGGPAWLTVGAIIALLVVLLAVLGLLSVVPFTPIVVFGMFLGLAVARLL